MEILKYIILVIYIIVCIALIVLATIQKSERPGASGTITGSSTNNFYEQNKGRTKEGKLKKMDNNSWNCVCCISNCLRNPISSIRTIKSGRISFCHFLLYIILKL